MKLDLIRQAGIEIVGDLSYRNKQCPLEDAEGVTLFAEWNRDPWLKNVPLIHIPNERKRKTGADFKELRTQKLKGAYQKGASDYVALGFPSLVMELKCEDHTMSDIFKEQIDFLVKCQKVDAWVCVACGWKAGIAFGRQWYKANYL